VDGQEDELKAGRKPGDDGFGVEPAGKHGTLTVMENGKPSTKTCPTVEPLTYGIFYQQLAKALAGEGDVPVKPEGSAEVIRLIELARQSSVEGRTLDVQ
jgi:predicted dehydrogenase